MVNGRIQSLGRLYAGGVLIFTRHMNTLTAQQPKAAPVRCKIQFDAFTRYDTYHACDSRYGPRHRTAAA